MLTIRMAGAEGFEPPLAVLETAGLPLNLRPYSDAYKQTSTAKVKIEPVKNIVSSLITAGETAVAQKGAT
jgi:hypothetical protein